MRSNISIRIKEHNKARLPEYTALKYQMMAENPFRFFRGAEGIFYEDIHASGQLDHTPGTWICGNLNLEVFSTYRGENKVFAFGINDYAQAALAPLGWELARMVSSIHLAFEICGFTPGEINEYSRIFLETYANVLGRGRPMDFDLSQAKGDFKKFLDQEEAITNRKMIAARTEEKMGAKRLRIDHARFYPVNKDKARAMKAHVNEWAKHSQALKRDYVAVDVCFRVAGTGSLGVQRYVFLMQEKNQKDKYILVEMLETEKSAIELVGLEQPSWPSEGLRTLTLQDRMQQVPPMMASGTEFQGREYILRRLKTKSSFLDISLFSSKKETSRIIPVLAKISASSHLRGAGFKGAVTTDVLAAFGYNSGWQRPLLNFCEDYSSQVRRDYLEYLDAYKAGFFSALNK